MASEIQFVPSLDLSLRSFVEQSDEQLAHVIEFSAKGAAAMSASLLAEGLYNAIVAHPVKSELVPPKQCDRVSVVAVYRPCSDSDSLREFPRLKGRDRLLATLVESLCGTGLLLVPLGGQFVYVVKEQEPAPPFGQLSVAISYHGKGVPASG